MSASISEYIDKIIAKSNDLSQAEMLSLIDANSYTSENECDKLHLLRYVLHKLYCSSPVDPSSESEKHLLFDDAERFYGSVKYCKENINSICDNFVKKIRFDDIKNKNEFIFSIDDIDELKGKLGYIPNIQVANADEYMDCKTKEIVYRYLYSVIVKSYGKKAILPIMIFQSIFHKSDVLFRAVDDSFDKIIKKKHSLSKYNGAVIEYIQNNNMHVYKDKKDEREESLREKGFFKTIGERLTISDLFHYTPFVEKKPPRGIKKGLDAIGWYNYFFELCKLINEHKSELIEVESDIICGLSNQKLKTYIVEFDSCTILNLFEMNYIAFLCLSDIFDEIFIGGKFCGINNYDTYIYPAFRWGIATQPTHKTDDVPFRAADDCFEAITQMKHNFFREYKENAYRFLLDYMGIRQKREELKKH